jgi:hypothetical protein
MAAMPTPASHKFEPVIDKLVAFQIVVETKLSTPFSTVPGIPSPKVGVPVSGLTVLSM